jgi:hypothetical protein
MWLNRYMKSFKNFLENYDVYLDMVKKIHGLSGGKTEADERDDLYTPPTANYNFLPKNTFNAHRTTE